MADTLTGVTTNTSHEDDIMGEKEIARLWQAFEEDFRLNLTDDEREMLATLRQKQDALETQWKGALYEAEDYARYLSYKYGMKYHESKEAALR